MTNDGESETGASRGSSEEKRKVEWPLVAAIASMLAGITASVPEWWGEPFRLALTGIVCGPVVGFCTYYFMLSVALPVTLPMAKAVPKVVAPVFLVALMAAPVLAWFVVRLTLARML